MAHDIIAWRAQIDRTLAEVYGPPEAGPFGGPLKKVVTLVAEGDSWFDYIPSYDIVSQLRSRDWPVRYEILGKPRYGSLVNDMIYDGYQIADTVMFIRQAKPDAFLFSGGGNDIVGDQFFSLLNHHASGLPELNMDVARGIVDKTLRVAYERLIELIIAEATSLGRPNMPILVHGYAYAEPDGRGWAGGIGPLPGPWMDEGFDQKGYPKSGMDLRRRIVRELIDLFNEMLLSLAQQYPNNIKYLDLRPLLAQDPNDWGNELHPTRSGFEKVARLFDETIRALV